MRNAHGKPVVRRIFQKKLAFMPKIGYNKNVSKKNKRVGTEPTLN